MDCAGSPISSLPAASLPLGGSEAIPLVQGGVTSQVASGVFGQVVARANPGVLNADYLPGVVYRPTDMDHLILLVWQSVVVRVDGAAGFMNLTVLWTDQSGPRTFISGALNLNGADAIDEVFPVFVKKNTGLTIKFENTGGYETATYAVAWSGLLLL